MFDYLELEDMTYEDIPAEDKILCNNAEGCDNCKWNTVCFGEDDE